LDGKPTNLDVREATASEIPASGSEVFHNYLPEIFVAVDRPLGWLELEKGRHTLSFVCAGRDGRSAGYNLGVNDVILERNPVSPSVSVPTPERPRLQSTAKTVYRGRELSFYTEELRHAAPGQRADLLRSMGAFRADAASAVPEIIEQLKNQDAQVRAAAAWALSQIAPAGAAAIPALATSLSDPDPIVRSTSAIALRDMGDRAVTALPALVVALNDNEPYVRAPAADAIGKIGPPAKAAVQPLIDRLTVPGEQNYVLRSATKALGRIGPDAASALPVLQKERKMHRLSYVAEEAILRINGQPVPEW
jgi:HEAT repeat protein